MKTIISESIQIAIPKFTLLFEMIKSPLLAFFVLTPTVTTALVVNIWSAFYVLCWFFLGDLITGLLAAYFIWKKSDKKDKWFFGKGEGFSSDKFKKMFIKIIVYCGAPVVLHQFQTTFLIKNLSYKTISEAEVDIATFLILLFILNEGYSIFHENLPKCGFNLWELIRKMIGFYKKFKTEINEAKEV